jgi:hypothetical protein
VKKIPNNLGVVAYDRWLAKQSRAYLEDRALEEYFKGEEEDLDKMLDPRQKRGKRKGTKSSGHALATNYEEDRLTELLDKKTKHDLLNILDSEKRLFSPQQQKYLELKTLAFMDNPKATETELREYACNSMGINHNQGYQIEHKIKKILKKSLRF